MVDMAAALKRLKMLKIQESVWMGQTLTPLTPIEPQILPGAKSNLPQILLLVLLLLLLSLLL